MATTAHSGPAHESNALPNCSLEKAMETMINIYHRYAPRQDKNDFMSLKDLTEFLKDQAPTFLAACNRSRPGYIQELFKQADVDNNKQLTFEETVRVFAILADDAHRISHGEDRCGPDKD